MQQYVRHLYKHRLTPLFHPLTTASLALPHQKAGKRDELKRSADAEANLIQVEERDAKAEAKTIQVEERDAKAEANFIHVKERDAEAEASRIQDKVDGFILRTV
ncbi:24478_t:CDS:2 [Gigaspora rosea]|nr:24478_t:CDS:2 [Gigaspora rosea]